MIADCQVCFKVDKKLYLLINLLFVSKFDLFRFKLTINTLIINAKQNDVFGYKSREIIIPIG